MIQDETYTDAQSTERDWTDGFGWIYRIFGSVQIGYLEVRLGMGRVRPLNQFLFYGCPCDPPTFGALSIRCAFSCFIIGCPNAQRDLTPARNGGSLARGPSPSIMITYGTVCVTDVTDRRVCAESSSLPPSFPLRPMARQAQQAYGWPQHKVTELLLCSTPRASEWRLPRPWARAEQSRAGRCR